MTEYNQVTVPTYIATPDPGLRAMQINRILRDLCMQISATRGSVTAPTLDGNKVQTGYNNTTESMQSETTYRGGTGVMQCAATTYGFGVQMLGRWVVGIVASAPGTFPGVNQVSWAIGAGTAGFTRLCGFFVVPPALDGKRITVSINWCWDSGIAHQEGLVIKWGFNYRIGFFTKSSTHSAPLGISSGDIYTYYRIVGEPTHAPGMPLMAPLCVGVTAPIKAGDTLLWRVHRGAALGAGDTADRVHFLYGNLGFIDA